MANKRGYVYMLMNGMGLVKEVYRDTRGFPKDEVYGLTGQMRRAAVSIPAIFVHCPRFGI